MEERKQYIKTIFNSLLVHVENIESYKKCLITFNCEICSNQHKCSLDTLRLRKYKTYCNSCSKQVAGKTKTASFKQVEKECLNKYDNFYTYIIDEITYVNKKSIIRIICPIHGEFTKSVQKHLAGQACFRCRIDNLIKDGKLKGGYTENYFIQNPNECNKNAILYYVKIGNMYKIGITTNLYNRIKSLKSMFKEEVKVLDTLQGTLKQVYDIEQTILKTHQNSRLYTKKSTELFKYDILDSSLKSLI